MKTLLAILSTSVVILIGGAAWFTSDSGQAIAGDPLPNAVVKVTLDKGHGSSVHIGNGYYLTAAHVVAGKTGIKIKDETGDTADAELLWFSKKYDIAMLRSDKRVQKANLECRDPVFQEVIQMRGNPSNLEHVSTWGRVAGKAVEVPNFWAEAVPVDGAMAGGMSGGGVFDMEGDLIGVNVGGMLQSVGFGASFVGISYIVPSNTVCNLMGLNTNADTPLK